MACPVNRPDLTGLFWTPSVVRKWLGKELVMPKKRFGAEQIVTLRRFEKIRICIDRRGACKRSSRPRDWFKKHDTMCHSEILAAVVIAEVDIILRNSQVLFVQSTDAIE